MKRLSSMNVNNEFKIVGYRYFLKVLKMNDVFSCLLRIPVYFCASFSEMPKWRGTVAAFLEKEKKKKKKKKNGGCLVKERY